MATKMAKEKPQALNYNGAFILARTALQLKELDASFALHRVCFELASKLRSPLKLENAYVGMDATIRLYYLEKKNDKGLKASAELLELEEKLDTGDVLKAETYRLLLTGMIQAGRIDEARKKVDALVKARSKSWRNLGLKALVEKETRNYAAAVKVYEEMLPLLSKDDSLQAEVKAELEAEARLDIVDMLFRDKKYDKCVKAAEDLLDSLEKQGVSAKGKDQVLRFEVRALALQGKVKDAEKLLEKLGADEKGEFVNLDLKAWLEQQKGNEAGAAKLYEEMLARVKKGSEEARELYENDIRYLLSSIYIDMDQLDKAVEQLQFLLHKEPNNPTYNNDLGYIWADHDTKLGEAEKLIRKAIDLDREERKKKPGLKPDEDKDNAAYLDSLGWVLFKLKNYPDAKKYLLEAVKDKEGQHIEILDHLGDVYMALGDKAEAVNSWKKGLALETKSKREKERKSQVEKKLKANQ